MTYRCFICAKELKLKTVFNLLIDDYAVLVCLDCAGKLTSLFEDAKNKDCGEYWPCSIHEFFYYRLKQGEEV